MTSSALSITLPLESLVEPIAALVRERLGRAPRFVSNERLAEHLGVKTRTLETWRRQGLPYVRVGRTLMYDLEEVERWIESGGAG